ncbi:MAG: DUF350 domain-containing protein [Syntrophobacteraceae bacterium]
MFLGTISLAAVFLVAVMALFVIGKGAFALVHRSFNLNDQLVEQDNLALSIAVCGYFIGLTLAVGGTLSVPHVSLTVDLIDIFLYGLIAIVLLNVSARINDWIILTRVDAEAELVRDHNCGVGMIEAANHIAVGLVIYGTLASGGDIVAVLVFWLLGQATLIVASLVYHRMAPYDVQQAIEQDNVAVGTAFAGMLLAIGNIVRVACQTPFVSWTQNLTFYASVVAFGLVVLPLARLVTDRLILPGKRLTDELIRQERPNIGAGALEATVYVAMSFLVGWCIR